MSTSRSFTKSIMDLRALSLGSSVEFTLDNLATSLWIRLKRLLTSESVIHLSQLSCLGVVNILVILF